MTKLTRISTLLLTNIRELLKKKLLKKTDSVGHDKGELYSELISNAVRNGKEAVEKIVRNLNMEHEADYDLIIIGADPAGISASLTAKQNRLRFLLLEQETLRKSLDAFFWHRNGSKLKIAVPLAGEMTISKNTWQDLITYYRLPYEENCRVRVEQDNGLFRLHFPDLRIFTSASLIFATGHNGKLCEIGLSKAAEPIPSARPLELSRSN